MSTTLLISLLAFVPVALLLAGAIRLILTACTLPAVLQVLGAASFLLVVLTHLCEGLGMLSAMHWGRPQSFGHYLDLASALLGVVLFPVGYALWAYSQGRRVRAHPPAVGAPGGTPSSGV